MSYVDPANRVQEESRAHSRGISAVWNLVEYCIIVNDTYLFGFVLHRFKVRTEIARQQKDKESEFLQCASRGVGGMTELPKSIEKIMTESAAEYTAGRGAVKQVLWTISLSRISYLCACIP